MRILFTLIFFTACASETITQPGNMVRTAKSDPEKECKELGVVSWSNQGSFKKLDSQQIRIRLRNQAGELGGNFLRIDNTDTYKESGTVFNCP